MDRVAVAAGVLLWSGGPDAPAFLVLRNARHATWGFAKGHLEDGEGLLAGALRECREEAGLQLSESSLLPGFADVSHYRTPEGVRKRVVMFLAARPCAVAEIVCSPEHDAMEWWTAEQAVERFEFEELRRSVIRAAEHLREGARDREGTG
ncbi:MAG: NUDIX domain-containing protein [Planctomycetota bacterium]|nr:NUDIX domain-containing protein [Planctomycetota bacterium]